MDVLYDWGMATAQLSKLYEYATNGSPRVDTESMVIGGVKILGSESRNGRTYTEAAMNDAVGLYEGVRVNIDHPEKARMSRNFAESFGVIKSSRRERQGETPGVYGDLHYIKSHPLAEMVVEKATRFPESFGLSHNAEGETKRRGGKVFVESLIAVESVDIVDRPATNSGLFESEGLPAMTTLKKLIEATEYKHTTKLLEMLPDEVDAAMDIAEPEVEQANPVEAVKQALADEAVKIFMDPAIDAATTGKKIKDLAKAAEDVANKVAPSEETAEETDEPEGDEEAKDEEAMESIKAAIGSLTESIATLAKRDTARTLLESKGAVANPQLVSELLECKDEAAMAKLVEGWSPQKLGKAKPRIGGKLLENEQAIGTYEEFIKRYQ